MMRSRGGSRGFFQGGYQQQPSYRQGTEGPGSIRHPTSAAPIVLTKTILSANTTSDQELSFSQCKGDPWINRRDIDMRHNSMSSSSKSHRRQVHQTQLCDSYSGADMNNFEDNYDSRDPILADIIPSSLTDDLLTLNTSQIDNDGHDIPFNKQFEESFREIASTLHENIPKSNMSVSLLDRIAQPSNYSKIANNIAEKYYFSSKNQDELGALPSQLKEISDSHLMNQSNKKIVYESGKMFSRSRTFPADISTRTNSYKDHYHSMNNDSYEAIQRKSHCARVEDGSKFRDDYSPKIDASVNFYGLKEIDNSVSVFPSNSDKGIVAPSIQYKYGETVNDSPYSSEAISSPNAITFHAVNEQVSECHSSRKIDSGSIYDQFHHTREHRGASYENYEDETNYMSPPRNIMPSNSKIDSYDNSCQLSSLQQNDDISGRFSSFNKQNCGERSYTGPRHSSYENPQTSSQSFIDISVKSTNNKGIVFETDPSIKLAPMQSEFSHFENNSDVRNRKFMLNSNESNESRLGCQENVLYDRERTHLLKRYSPFPPVENLTGRFQSSVLRENSADKHQELKRIAQSESLKHRISPALVSHRRSPSLYSKNSPSREFHSESHILLREKSPVLCDISTSHRKYKLGSRNSSINSSEIYHSMSPLQNIRSNSPFDSHLYDCRSTPSSSRPSKVHVRHSSKSPDRQQRFSSSVQHRARSPVQFTSRSSIQHKDRSPVQQRARSPIQHRARFPIHHRARSPIQHRTRSPIQHRARSPIRHKARSPIRHRARSPIQHRARSPIQHGARSPIQHRARSPIQYRARSPIQHRARSPDQCRAGSPFMQRARSPVQKRFSSPFKHIARSPVQHSTRSPVQHGARSPIQERARSPVEERARSPVQKRARSPVQKRFRSPFMHTARSPVQHKVRSPFQKRARSPFQHGARSPVQHRARSPVKQRARSPVQQIAKSPVQRRVGSPVQRRVGSPVQHRVGSPVQRRLGSLVQRRVGSPVQHRVGSPVQHRVGSPVQHRVGSPDHSRVGSPDHSRVGSPDHSRVGSPVQSRVERSLQQKQLQSPILKGYARPVQQTRSHVIQNRARSPVSNKKVTSLDLQKRSSLPDLRNEITSHTRKRLKRSSFQNVNGSSLIDTALLRATDNSSQHGISSMLKPTHQKKSSPITVSHLRTSTRGLHRATNSRQRKCRIHPIDEASKTVQQKRSTFVGTESLKPARRTSGNPASQLSRLTRDSSTTGPKVQKKKKIDTPSNDTSKKLNRGPNSCKKKTEDNSLRSTVESKCVPVVNVRTILARGSSHSKGTVHDRNLNDPGKKYDCSQSLQSKHDETIASPKKKNYVPIVFSSKDFENLPSSNSTKSLADLVKKKDSSLHGSNNRALNNNPSRNNRVHSSNRSIVANRLNSLKSASTNIKIRRPALHQESAIRMSSSNSKDTLRSKSMRELREEVIKFGGSRGCAYKATSVEELRLLLIKTKEDQIEKRLRNLEEKEKLCALK